MAFRQWFTLYFLPVLPLGSGEESVVCQRCGSSYEPQILNNFDPAGTRHGVVERRGDPFFPDTGADPFFPEPAARLPRPAETSGLAIASLVTALVSFGFLPCGASVLTSLAAIITGHMSLVKINRSGGRLTGRGMGIFGTTLGYVMLVGSVVVLSYMLSALGNRPRIARRADDGPPPLARPADAADAAAPLRQRPVRPGAPELDRPGPAQTQQAWIEEDVAGVERPDADLLDADLLDADLLDADLLDADLLDADRPTPKLLDGDQGDRSARPRLSRQRGGSPDVVRVFPDMGWGVKSLAFAPGGRWLAAGKMDRALLVLDVQSGATRGAELKLDELSQVTQVAFSADGRYLAAAGSSGAVRVWSVDRGGALSDAQMLRQHARSVGCLAFSPAAPFLITGSKQGDLIWQTYRGATTQSRQQEVTGRAAVAVHLPKSGMRAVVTDGQSLARIDLKSADVVETHGFRRGVAHAAAFSDDGAKLAISDGYDIEIWDAAGLAPLTTLEADHEIQWSVAFLPGGQRLVSGGRGRVTLWDVPSGEAIRHFDLGGVLYIQTLAVSADGRLLAAIPASAGQSLTVLRLPQ